MSPDLHDSTPGEARDPSEPDSDSTPDQRLSSVEDHEPGATPGHDSDWDSEWPDWNDDWSDGWEDHDTGRGGQGSRSRVAGSDDPRVAAGLDHLQRAAREVIAASRALLDAAEDLVERPEGMARLAGVVADLGDLAGRTVRAAAADVSRPGQGRAGRRPGGGAAGDGPDHPDHPDDPDDGSPVQRIPVS